jgi:hypothetical protein
MHYDDYARKQARQARIARCQDFVIVATFVALLCLYLTK